MDMGGMDMPMSMDLRLRATCKVRLLPLAGNRVLGAWCAVGEAGWASERRATRK